MLSKTSFQLTYIDAFAGSVVSKLRKNKGETANSQDGQESFFIEIDEDTANQEDQFILGSPMRALNAGKTRKFDSYYFVDLDNSRAQRLKELRLANKEKNIFVINQDANRAVQEIVSTRFGDNQRYSRGVAFLDPYGPNLHWDTIKCIADSKKIDVIINFPLQMAINRLILRNKDDFSEHQKWLGILNSHFGSEDWQSVVYEKEETDLFGNSEPITKREDSQQRLLEYYCHNLKTVFDFVSAPRAVNNTKGVTIYYLIWASNHERGLAAADHILTMKDLGVEPTFL